MTFRDAILPALSAVDGIAATLDLAPTRVEVVVRRWSGGSIRNGVPGEEILPLPHWIVVKEVTAREVASSGGRFEMGDLKIGPIRPYFIEGCCEGGAPGGFTREQLDPRVDDDLGAEVIYRVRQAHSLGTGVGGDYRLTHLHGDDPLAWTAYVRRRTQPSDDPEVPQLPPPL